MDSRQARDRRREVLQQEIGLTVRRLAEARDLTQQDVADRMGRPRQFLTRLESGRDVAITPDVIEDLCDALKVPPQDVLEPLLRRIQTQQGGIGVTLLALRGDPSTHRWNKAQVRLSQATMDLPASEIEFIADLLEGRARAATETPKGSPGRLTHSPTPSRRSNT